MKNLKDLLDKFMEELKDKMIKNNFKTGSA
jgi:hypothetical protein